MCGAKQQKKTRERSTQRQLRGKRLERETHWGLFTFDDHPGGTTADADGDAADDGVIWNRFGCDSNCRSGLLGLLEGLHRTAVS